MRIGKKCGGALAALMLAALAGVTPARAAAAADGQGAVRRAPQGAADGAHLQLRWELVRNVFGPSSPDGRTEARLILTNLDTRPLPARGWSLYANWMDGVSTGPLAGGLVLEQVAGNLFRIRPTAGFPGLAPGRTLAIDYQHPDLVIKLAKAPAGPYIVYDAAPEVGQALADYQLLPVTRPEQLDQGAGAKALVTPQDTYIRNTGADALPAGALPPVFPTPLRLAAGGGRLHLAAMPAIAAPASLKNEAALARALLGAALPDAAPGAGAPAPRLTLGLGAVPGQSSPEAYTLAIGADSGIAIVGNSAAGVAYGLQSLRDLLPLPGAAGGGADLPELAITDAPRFPYRGFQLDVGRNFHTKQTVFKMLDLMARYKLNTFHFHLTEDEGWRLEIGGLPELTAIGAVRGHSAALGVRLQPAYGSGPDPADASGSGYYSRADYIEILRYAAARHIEVIPEIEMPGHARAAVQAMEARYRRLKAAGRPDAARYLLSDLADKSVYKSPQLYNDNVINPGLESSFTFIGHVVKEIVAMHRDAGVALRTIHVGGDELSAGAWENSPAALALMRANHLEGAADLWDYFYDRVDAILKEQGLYASGWEELAARATTLRGKSKLIPNPHFVGRRFSAYVWNNTDGAEDFAYRLANAGYDVVLAPVTKMYMDMSHNPNPEEPGVNWGGYVELDTVFDFDPLDYLKGANPVGKDGLTDYGKRHVRGLEATLFTETVRDPARIDYLVMPRLLAMAERAWAPAPAWANEADAGKAAALHRAAWSGFVNTLSQRVLPRLDLERAGVAYRIAPPGLVLEQGRVLANHVLPGITLRYTSDGSAPTTGSALVAGAIAERGVIRVAAFDRNGRPGLDARIDNP
nr:family 20 glycosylhydrolase [uncultured Duganella sp.]